VELSYQVLSERAAAMAVSGRRRMSVVLVSPTGSRLPGLAGYRPRVASGPRGVRPTDTVAVLAGPGMAATVRELSAYLGAAMPRVLVVAPDLDEDDVRAAFAHGATSYVVLGRAGCFLPAAVEHTALGETFIPPVVATVLHRRSGPGDRAPAHVLRDALSYREQQIMDLLARAHSVSEVAARLALTEKTVRNNLSSIYAKLQVRRQSEAVLRWLGEPGTARRASMA
jgi:DNA-binding NarL/FixJ family response regulator